jgi:hypothetical protein
MVCSSPSRSDIVQGEQFRNKELRVPLLLKVYIRILPLSTLT